MIFISILTIYLIYKITQSLTQSKTASLYSAILSSTSLMFISLSITGKHWVPILFFYTLCLFILTRPNWSIKKRYILSAITVGIGTGVSTVVILFSIVIFLWYITYDKVSMKESLTSLLMYKLGFIVVILSFIPVLLYPASLGFVPDTKTKRDEQEKSTQGVAIPNV
jgi:4-amino-4-deoxy-L-arabinose transferase-like glycosyltransferase